MNLDFQEILKELEFRVHKGIIDLTKEEQVTELVNILRENGVSDANQYAQRARVIFGFVTEAGDPLSKADKALNQTVINKDTNNPVLVSTALTYKNKKGKGAQQAYQDAKAIVAQAGASPEEIEKLTGEKQKGDKKEKPVASTIKVSDAEKRAAEKKEVNWKEVEKKSKQVGETLYGKGNKGNLLQNSATSDAALKNGYTEGDWWVAPGNAGSNFNENMSNEAAVILSKKPDMDEETLAMVIFNKTRGTKLAKQQSDPAIKSEDKIKVPPGLSKEEQILYKNCVITARSGRRKYERLNEGVITLQQTAGFGKKAQTMSFGGTSRKENTPKDVKTDRDSMLNEVDNAKNCYIYDPETKKAYKIEKEQLKQWIKDSGGGENAADTVVMTKDEKGNLLYDGWSDKKTLADLQANGTLNNDMVQSSNRINEMIKNGQIKEADSKNARKIIDDGTQSIKMIERGYSVISANHSKYHLSLSPDEFKKMEEYAKNSDDTKSHYSKFEERIKIVASGSGKNDAKSVAIAEQISGIKRKKSKEEIDADNFIQDTLDKYGEDSPAQLLKNEEVPAELKQQIKKAQDAGKKGRAEYMVKFNDWLGDKKNQNTIKSLSPFKIINGMQIASPDVVSDDERKIIDRPAAFERQKYISSNKKIPKQLDTQSALESMRKQAFDTQRGIFEKLSKIPATSMTGKKTNAAAALGFKDAVSALHLDKIDLPKDDKDIHQILKRSTWLAMEGIAVSPKTIKNCLGVSNTKELEEHFVVDFETERFIKNKEGFVTGKTIAIYLVDKDKKKREISPKVFRPKAGPQAKTSNTLAWSDDMQKCFDSKRNSK